MHDQKDSFNTLQRFSILCLFACNDRYWLTVNTVVTHTEKLAFIVQGDSGAVCQILYVH
jgi:hypothetical protein